MGTFGHVRDSNTFALWRYDDATNSFIVDECLRISLSGSTFGGIVTSPLINDGGRARAADGGLVCSSPLSGSLSASLLNGDWTLESWARPGQSALNSILEFQGAFGGPNTGVLFHILPQSSTQMICKVTSGSAASFASSSLAENHALRDRVHYAFRKTTVNSSASIEFFVDGVKVDTQFVDQTPFTFFVQRSIMFYATVRWFGVMDDTRFSTVARTDSEIFSSYFRGTYGIAGVPPTNGVKSSQFQRGVKFANVPGGRPEFATVDTGAGLRVRHVNTVMNVIQQPSDKSSKSGVIRFRSGKVPVSVNLKEGRNLDVFGNPIFR